MTKTVNGKTHTHKKTINYKTITNKAVNDETMYKNKKKTMNEITLNENNTKK